MYKIKSIFRLKRVGIFLIFQTILLWVCFISNAQDFEDIYNKYISSIGGQKAIDSVKTIIITGLSQNSVEQTERVFKAYHKAPNLLKYEFFNEKDSFWTCFDGKNLWTYLPKKGKPILASNFSGEVDLDPMFNHLVNYKRAGLKGGLLGKKAIDDKIYFEIYLEGNNREYYFYLEEKSLALNIEKVVAPNSVRETIYSDYRWVNGILIPYVLESRNEGSSFSTTRRHQLVEINSNMNLSIFQCSPDK